MFLNIDAIKDALCDNSPEDLAVMIENELEKVAQEELAKKAAADKAKEKENEISLLRDMAVEAIAEYFEALGIEITDSRVEEINNLFQKYEKFIPAYMENVEIAKKLNKNKNWTTFLF